MFDPGKPYNELPWLPPELELETKAILKRCITARAALAELRLAGHLIPDQTVLINVIPILEARASSEIENIVTTNDALFREANLNDENSDPTAKEALRYRTALHQGFETLKSRPLTTKLAVELCQTIKGAKLDVRKTPGTTLRNMSSGEVIYTPPQGEALLRELLNNWERFLNERNDIDPVVKMAVQHYQFEAIHPFVDGNGRTGRILNLLYLVQEKLLDMPTLYLSRHILRTRPEYYQRLASVTTSNDWVGWILYMLEAVEETAVWTNAKVRAIRHLMDDAARHIQHWSPKIYSRELVDVIFAQPYCRIANLVDRGIAKRQAASTYLKTLAQFELLDEVKAGREKLFINRNFLELLSSDDHEFRPYRASFAETVKDVLKKEANDEPKRIPKTRVWKDVP